jgi:hypothetical protein
MSEMDYKQDEMLLDLLGAKTISIANIKEINSDEWEMLIQRAKAQNVAPLLYYRLANSNLINDIPKNISLQLHKTYLGTLSVNIRLYKELAKILKLLQDEGIPVITLKGIALAEIIYQNIALRPMSDIDLVIKSDDLNKINQIMLNSGWENQSYLNRIGFDEQHFKHIAYSKGNSTIEVHPKIYELPLLDPWMKAVRTEIAKTDTFILGTEDFLMHLCLHLEDHYRTGMTSNLIWYLDIVEFLKFHQNDIDWDYVIITAKKNKANGYLLRVLKAVNEDFNCNVSPNILNQLENGKSDTLHVKDTLKPVNSPIRDFYALISEVFGSRSFPIYRRVYIAFRNIFPHKDFMIHRYSEKYPKLFFLYYFVRIGLGFSKFFKGLSHLPFYLKRKKNLHD